jgi:hypothetical protein
MRYDVGRFRRPMRRSTEGQLASLVSLGDGSTLTLDFTTGILDPRLSFTRLSTATFINSSGIVTSVGNNTPRFDHDPSTLAPRGLLIEGQSSTLNQWSEDFTSAYWQKVNSTVDTSTSVTCPDNIGRTTVRVVDNATNASHSIRRGITTAAGTTYTLSFFVKKGSTDTFAAQCYWNASYNFTLTVSSIDNDTQTLTSASGVNATSSRVAYAAFGSSPWYRYSVTFTHPAAVTGTITPDFNFCPINNVAAYVGSGNHTDFFGIQLETGSGASSYIPTGASTATRDRDQVTLTNLSSINFSQTEGTCLATVEVREKADSTFLPYGSFDTSGGGRCWWWLRHNLSTVSGTRLLGNAFDSGGSTALTTANYVYNGGSGGVVKFATSLNTAASSMVFVISGGAPQTTTAAAFTLATAAQWGLNTSTDVGATALGSMWVQSFKYWPTALPNAQLQSLTL